MKTKHLLIPIMILGFNFSFNPTHAQTWKNVSTPQMGNAQHFCVHNNALFVSTSAGAGGPHKSTDGQSWTQKNNGLDGKGIQGAGMDVLGSWIYYGSKGNIHRSADGEKWDTVGTGIEITANNYVRWFYEFDGTYFCVLSAAIVNGGGVYRSSDGTNWTLSTSGIATNNTCLQMTKLGSKLYVGTNLDFFESSDNGKTWTSALPANKMLYNGTTEYKNRWLIFTSTGVIHSDNQGTTWSKPNSDLKGTIQCGFIEGRNDTLFGWAASSGVFYSLDTGSTWTDYSGDLTTNDKRFMQEVVQYKNALYLSTLLAIKTTATGGSTSGTKQKVLIDNFRVYPNPVSNNLKVVFPNLTSATTIRIVDLLGVTKIERMTTKSSTTIPTDMLKPGVYLINVHSTSNNHLIYSSPLLKN